MCINNAKMVVTYLSTAPHLSLHEGHDLSGLGTSPSAHKLEALWPHYRAHLHSEEGDAHTITH